MDGCASPELERIHYEKLRHVHIFVNSILFRKMHEHGALEIDLVLDGRGKVSSSAGTFDVSPGSLVLFNSYDPHELTADGSQPMLILSLQISRLFLDSYSPQLPRVSFLSSGCPDIPDADRSVLRGHALAAAASYFAEEPFYELGCLGQISLLLTELLRLIPWEVMPVSRYASIQNRSARIRRITGYIDRHYREKISLAALAQQEGVTVTHLSHFFKDAFRVSFQEYLGALRLEKALALMKNSDAYLVDVCLECGFSNTRYLNRMFLKEFGCTASEYRSRADTPVPGDRGRPLTQTGAEYSHSRSESLAFVREAAGEI